MPLGAALGVPLEALPPAGAVVGDVPEAAGGGGMPEAAAGAVLLGDAAPVGDKLVGDAGGAAGVGVAAAAGVDVAAVGAVGGAVGTCLQSTYTRKQQ